MVLVLWVFLLWQDQGSSLLSPMLLPKVRFPADSLHYAPSLWENPLENYPTCSQEFEVWMPQLAATFCLC